MSLPTVAARRRALLAWHDRDRRDLPWRHTADPYRVLVSEVMLQQTQAARVAAVFDRFLAGFPTVETLADAPMAAVLDAWQGLGYYRRARWLRDAARTIVDTGWPTTAAGLQALPGIGPYTAAAVASLAFNEHIAAIDTNLRRVLSRWHGEPLGGSRLRETASADLGRVPARSWNEAMMDLGAGVCTARRPACHECPVARWCSGPEAYEPPRRPSPYPGSVREARAGVLRGLAGGPATAADLGRLGGIDGALLLRALTGLAGDGMIVNGDGWWRLAD